MTTGSTAPTPPDRRDGRLPDAQVAEVVALAEAAADTDGTYPLAEHAVLHLRHGGDPPAIHLLARDRDGRLTGYAHLDPAETGPAELTGELVVHPAARRRGWGRALATAALAAARDRPGPSAGPADIGTTDTGAADTGAAGTGPDSRPAGTLRLWAHGDLPAAGALARALGFTRTRVLYQLRRSLAEPVPAPVLPDGVTVRPFRPGADDRAWLAVNARAFADHPEQGRWTATDLRMRQAEPWFDPDGFLLAVRERDGRLLGFHWTKMHGAATAPGAATVSGGTGGPSDGPGQEPIGEVYVLGVDPAAHGLGLGSALARAGLRYLRDRGLAQAMLYVEESNPAAVALYRKLDFADWSVDATYARDP